MDNDGVLIRFQGVDSSIANKYASDLADSLERDCGSLDVQQLRDDPLAQDFGATLAIVLGSTAVTALASGIAKWIARHHDAELTLRRTLPSGEVKEAEIKGRPSGTVESIVTKLFE